LRHLPQRPSITPSTALLLVPESLVSAAGRITQGVFDLFHYFPKLSSSASASSHISYLVFYAKLQARYLFLFH
jgi:hypothetical protein